jgi:Capsular polysaccharide synthesis protein/Polysaccharide pyruvyl transferase/Methyltransferase domain
MADVEVAPALQSSPLPERGDGSPIAKRTVWTCWFQGRSNAPDVVKRCLSSWEQLNPGWDLRCLDATSINRYLSLDRYVDLNAAQITAASLSDIVRMLVLHEYGGVWVDATVLCNQPLDEWLTGPLGTGFFAFANSVKQRVLATWFIACKPGNALLTKWATHALGYWRGRARSNDYFWLHHQFAELCDTDPDARRAWEAVPRVSTVGPHTVRERFYEPFESAAPLIDWSSPVFKLDYRVNEQAYRPGCTLHTILHRIAVPHVPAASATAAAPPMHFAGLKVSTENLGDHVQLLAANRLLRRSGIAPEVLLDRDNEIASARAIDAMTPPVGILLNGWYKTNPAEWPPNPRLDPIYLGFHTRLFQSPTLVSPEAIEHYKLHEPIGCRDRYTAAMLRSHGVDTYLSYCLSLLYERRLLAPETQTETFVVSRDRGILGHLPASLGESHFIAHYSGTFDFHENMLRVAHLLERYRTRAKLIVTTLLHCALPAVAMGIPVVAFYPANSEPMHASDRERFSSLERLIRVFRLEEAPDVDWGGYTADVSYIKLSLLDRFYETSKRWQLPPNPPLGPVAPSQTLPHPATPDAENAAFEAERADARRELAKRTARRWGDKGSYNLYPAWAERAQVASRLVPDGACVLEIGVGTGEFRRLVGERCFYLGADLNPLDGETIALNLDADPLPEGRFDYVVLLGVFEYLRLPELAAKKLCAAADTVLISYCCKTDASPEAAADRLRREWWNGCDESEFVALFTARGKSLRSRTTFNTAPYFEQVIFTFS